MSLDKLTRASNLIKGAVAVIAFFPGIALYFELIEVPPDLVGVGRILSVSISIMVVVCIPLFADRIYALGKHKVALIAFIAVMLGATCLVGYLQFAKNHIVTATTEEGDKKFIIPLSPSPRIQEIVGRTEGGLIADSYRPALETSADRQELKEALANESLGSFLVMVALLIFAQVLLVAPPVAAAWRLTAEDADDDPPAKDDK